MLCFGAKYIKDDAQTISCLEQSKRLALQLTICKSEVYAD